MNYLVLFVTNISTVSEDSLGAPEVGLGAANKVNVLLSLHSTAPALQNPSVSLPLWIVQPKYIKYKSGGH